MRSILAIAILSIAATPAMSASQCEPGQAQPVVTVTEIPTYPAGEGTSIKTTVYANGCLVTEYPSYHKWAGEHRMQVPTAQFDSAKASWRKAGMFQQNEATLKSSLAAQGVSDLKDWGGMFVDGSTTRIEWRDPTTGKAAQTIDVYALDQLTVPESAKVWRDLQSSSAQVKAWSATAARLAEAKAQAASQDPT